jgi:hypothetical protein
MRLAFWQLQESGFPAVRIRDNSQGFVAIAPNLKD